MKNRFASLAGSKGFGTVISTLASIIVGLLVGFLLMEAFKPGNGWAAFTLMLKGGVQTGLYGVGNILYYMTPMIFTGLSVAFSFNTGIFNMGVTGQFTIGAFVAILVGGMIELPPAIHWVVCVLAGGLAGVLWALVPALLKAYYNVNEIITTIMTNYIAMYFANEIISKFWYNQPMGVSQSIHESAVIPRAGLGKIFQGTNVNLGIVIALIFAVAVYIILFKTSFGYGLRAVGLNPDAGKYMGVNEKVNIITSMLLSGFIAGFGGAVIYISSLTKTYPVAEALLQDANFAIPIALLGASNPFGVVAASGFISFLFCGSLFIQAYGYTSETVDVITSVIIYFSAFSLMIRMLLDKFVLNADIRRGRGPANKKEGQPAGAAPAVEEVKR